MAELFANGDWRAVVQETARDVLRAQPERVLSRASGPGKQTVGDSYRERTLA